MRDVLLKFLRALVKRSAKPMVIDGLWVGAGGADAAVKVSEALALIKRCDPLRYARILNDLEGILVDILPGALGQFSYKENFCDLDERFVKTSTPAQIATVIVYEATHARLWKRGIRYGEELRARVEYACIRQEKLFASKMPRPEIDLFERRLTLGDTSFYSDAAFHARRRHGSIAALRYLGMPHRLIAVSIRIRRGRIRRMRKRRHACKAA